jgi:hypothetical protein
MHVATRHVGWKHLFDLQLQAQAQALRCSPISQANRTTTLIDALIPTLPPYNIFNSQVVSAYRFLIRRVCMCYLLTFVSILQYAIPLAIMDAYALLVVNMQKWRTFMMDPSYYLDRNEGLVQHKELMNEIRAVLEEFNEVHRTMKHGWDTQVAEWPMDNHGVIGTIRNT